MHSMRRLGLVVPGILFAVAGLAQAPASVTTFWHVDALSNVQYTITVTDTLTQAVKTYTNPSGTLASVADTKAF